MIIRRRYASVSFPCESLEKVHEMILKMPRMKSVIAYTYQDNVVTMFYKFNYSMTKTAISKAIFQEPSDITLYSQYRLRRVLMMPVHFCVLLDKELYTKLRPTFPYELRSEQEVTQ